MMTFQNPSERFVDLEGSLNFRDFGGYPTQAGGHIMKGRLFRCGMLSDFTATGIEGFRQLDIGVICDLRGSDEVELYPTPNLPLFDCQKHIPIAPGTSSALRGSVSMGQHSAADRSAFMQEITREIACDHVAAYAQMFRALIDTEQGFLVHCMAGKDRTGFGVAVIQMMLGVSETLVMADYLLTNDATELVTRTRARMLEQGVEIDEASLEVISQVKREYLGAALAGLKAEFGGIEGYLEAAEVLPVERAELMRRLVA
jgi:protein-tyrosine phosphatase